MRRSLSAFCFLFVMVVSGAPSAHATDFGPQAEQFVQTLADKAITDLQTVNNDAQRVEKLRALLNEGFDITAIGKWVMGRAWRKATPEQRTAYLGVFGDFVVLTYANRFGDFGDTDIGVTIADSIVKNDRDAIVRTQITTNTTEEPLVIDWRVKKNKQNIIKIVDVVVAGVSMSQAQRSEFASVIKRQGGVDGLIKALETKVTALAP